MDGVGLIPIDGIVSRFSILTNLTLLTFYFKIQAFYKLNDYMNSKACLALPESLSGQFKLIALSDSVLEASINHDQIQSVTIT